MKFYSFAIFLFFVVTACSHSPRSHRVPASLDLEAGLGFIHPLILDIEKEMTLNGHPDEKLAMAQTTVFQNGSQYSLGRQFTPQELQKAGGKMDAPYCQIDFIVPKNFGQPVESSDLKVTKGTQLILEVATIHVTGHADTGDRQFVERVLFMNTKHVARHEQVVEAYPDNTIANMSCHGADLKHQSLIDVFGVGNIKLSTESSKR